MVMSTLSHHAGMKTWSSTLVTAQQELIDAANALAAARERRAVAVVAALEGGCHPGEVACLLRLTESAVDEMVRNRAVLEEHQARLRRRSAPHRVFP